MAEALLDNLKTALANLDSSILLGAGVAFTFAGLAAWLAGVGIGRLAAGVVGGLLGCICGYAVTHHVGLMVGVGIFVGAVAGLGLELILGAGLGYASFGYNFILAALHSVFGSSLIFLGMVLLLFYKGAYPLRHIMARPQFYAILFFAMVVFGTLEQLVFCAKGKDVEIRLKRAKPKELQPVHRQGWRNR